MAKRKNGEIEETRRPYEVLNPKNNYCGKSYSELTTDWFNWFLSAHADKRNSGPVVFLRSHGLPNKITGAYTSDVPSQVTSIDTDSSQDGHITDPNYQTTYVNDPNIRTGGDKLQIFADQAVFVPIIVSYKLASAPSIDWGYLQDYTGFLIDNGDNPPDKSQLTIDKQNIELPKDLKMEDFRISTPIFTAIVPEAPYGTSIKDFLEEGPIPPASYQAMVDGYFVMLKFPESDKSYFVSAWASAGREPRGPYFSELLYEIEVLPLVKQRRHGMITTTYPARNEEVTKRILNKKEKITKIEEITPEATIVKSIRDNLKQSIRENSKKNAIDAKDI